MATPGAIRTNAAAAMLGVSPSTLRSWERRFGFPEPARTEGGHRQYDLDQVEALRAAFEQTGEVSSAVTIARDRGAGPATDLRLRSALARFDEDGADRLLEESLALRSLERTVAEVLIPAVTALHTASGEAGPSAELSFAWRHASRWLDAAFRVSPPASREEGVLIVDSTGPLELDALHVRALELVLRRAGLRTLTLSAAVPVTRMGHALRALRPRAVVLAGEGLSLDGMGRIVYAARQVVGEQVAVFDLGGRLRTTGASLVQVLDPGDLTGSRDRVLGQVTVRCRPDAASGSGPCSPRTRSPIAPWTPFSAPRPASGAG